MEAKEITQWRDEEALRRYTLIAPLTDPCRHRLISEGRPLLMGK